MLPRILHATCCFLLAAPPLLLAMDPFKVHSRRYLLFVCGTIFRGRKKPPIGDHHALQKGMRVSDPKLHKQYGRALKKNNASTWEHERGNIVLVGSYAKFAQNQAMQRHLLVTGNRLLAEGSPYDTIWGVGYRADHENANCPPTWRGLNLLGKALHIVRKRLRDRAPSPPRPRTTASAPPISLSPVRRSARAESR